ncbi:MAG: DMT family transporter [Chloroflexi bacterium]|nr:DMT family transporter [Chloroflexota bacterium]
MLGEASALGASFSWALTSILLRTQVTKLGAIGLTGWLFAFASVPFLVLLFATSKARELWQITLLWLLLLLAAAIVGRVLGDLLWVKSLQAAGVSRSLPASVSSYPLFTIFLAVLFLDEAMSYVMAIGGILVMVGIYLVAHPPRHAEAEPPQGKPALVKVGVSLAVLAGLLWAVETIILKRGLERFHPITISIVELPIAAAALLLIAGMRGGGMSLRKYGGKGIAAIAAAAALGVVMGGLLFLFAVSRAGAAKTAILASTSPLFGLPLAFLILREPLTRKVAVGTASCLLGIFLLMA